jgi:hypothetical protein
VLDDKAIDETFVTKQAWRIGVNRAELDGVTGRLP